MRFLVVFILLGWTAWGQDTSDTGGLADRLWLSGQANFISQGHTAFQAPYSGPNSLPPDAQYVTSRVLTLYTGFRLTNTTDFVLDIEETGGNGIGQALGIAGFPNLDVVRNPTLSHRPYVARVMFHQMIPLSSEIVEAERGPLQLAGSVPVRRLDVRFGKMSTVDWFDVNAVGSDSHLQFMNWTLTITRRTLAGIPTDWFARARESARSAAR